MLCNLYDPDAPSLPLDYSSLFDVFALLLCDVRLILDHFFSLLFLYHAKRNLKKTKQNFKHAHKAPPTYCYHYQDVLNLKHVYHH